MLDVDDMVGGEVGGAVRGSQVPGAPVALHGSMVIDCLCSSLSLGMVACDLGGCGRSLVPVALCSVLGALGFGLHVRAAGPAAYPEPRPHLGRFNPITKDRACCFVIPKRRPSSA